MQHVQAMPTSRPLGIDKIALDTSGNEIFKKTRVVFTPRDVAECRVSRVTTDRDRNHVSAVSNPASFQFAIIADKYQLFEQVEGSSLYRCVDIQTKEELVCKVGIVWHSSS